VNGYPDESMAAGAGRRTPGEKAAVRYREWIACMRAAGIRTESFAARLNRMRTYADRAYDERLFQRILKWNGLLAEGDPTGRAMMPEYEVAVCEHSCIAVYHRPVSGHGGALGVTRELPLPPSGYEDDRLIRRLARTAIRAVYALGLDIGLVRMVIAPGGQMAVRSVDPFPLKPRGVIEKYAAALRIPAEGGADVPISEKARDGAASAAQAIRGAPSLEDRRAFAPSNHVAPDGIPGADHPTALRRAVPEGEPEGDDPASDERAQVEASKSALRKTPAVGASETDEPAVPGRTAPIDRARPGLSSAERLRNESILVGLDIEFVLTDAGGSLVPADRFLPRGGPAGHDGVVMQGRMVRALAELRPSPSREPRRLYAELTRTMRLAARRIRDPALAWRAGATPVPGVCTGGHIHFSGVALSFELLRALDNYLALPLALLEDDRAIERRAKFGWLGHARMKPHGGFEYRTPPSWIVSPTVARGVLALAKLIAVHHDSLVRRPLDELRMQKAYYAGEKRQLRRFLDLWRQDIAGTRLYSEYEEDIAPFIRLIESGWSWNEEADLRAEWSFPGAADFRAPSVPR